MTDETPLEILYRCLVPWLVSNLSQGLPGLRLLSKIGVTLCQEKERFIIRFVATGRKSARIKLRDPVKTRVERPVPGTGAGCACMPQFESRSAFHGYFMKIIERDQASFSLIACPDFNFVIKSPIRLGRHAAQQFNDLVDAENGAGIV
jgi:hypothetical protein